MNILALDRGAKILGAAWRSSTTKIVMPIGSLHNNEELLSNISELIVRYEITKVVFGEMQHKSQKERLEKLCEALQKMNPGIEIVVINEAYSSVQADMLLHDAGQHAGQDTVAAMYILEHFLVAQKSIL